MATLDSSAAIKLDTFRSDTDAAQAQHENVNSEGHDRNHEISSGTRTRGDSPRGPWSTKDFGKDDGHGRYGMPIEDEEDEHLLSDQQRSGLGRVRRPSAGARYRYLIIAIVALVSAIVGSAIPTIIQNSGGHSRDTSADWGKPGTITEGLSRYPTDLLRDVVPIPCHSHNDYWRKVPLFSALYAGFTGVEADVWSFDDELYVGHNTASLTRNRTFQSLYVDPLVDLLERQNPTTEFYSGKSHGVFDTESGQTLVLMVDLKTDGVTTWPLVTSQLEPLRQRNWLTFVQDGIVHKRPITVVGTGNAPFELLVANATYRDAFFDAPLDELWTEPSGSEDTADSMSQRRSSSSEKRGSILRERTEFPGANAESSKWVNVGRSPEEDYNSGNSYYASTSFQDAVGTVWFNRLSQKQFDIIRGQIRGAHERGLKARYWQTPAWPLSLRNYVWRVLIDEGIDYLNVDDLKAAEKGIW